MKANKLFWTLWLVWMVLNVLTGLWQEIHTDEAYYHFFGQYVDWCYYDHPPMIGWMAAMSNHFVCACTLPGVHNLTVRLMTILSFGLTLWLIWLTTVEDRKPSKHLVLTFYMVAAGMVMFTTAGFLLTPDSPLMLFVALFYYAYQQYLKGDRPWMWAMVLGVAIAGMLYSKYMGVLVVIFTILSNLRVVKDGRLWCAVGVSLVLLLPHLCWLFTSEMTSLQYHLDARHDGFCWRYVLDYWPNQLVVYNPLLLVMMLWAGIVAIQRRAIHRLEAALGTTVLGFILFFAAMSWRGHVEPHWTMAASVPAIILLTRYVEDGQVAWMQRKWVRVTLWVMVGLCLVARLVLWTNRLPYDTNLGSRKAYFDVMKKVCGGRVMVTVGSYPTVSLYRFWEGEAILTHDMHVRHTQYELVDIDRNYQGQPACVVNSSLEGTDTIVNGRRMAYTYIERLQLTDRIELKVQRIQITQDSLLATISAYNPYSVDFEWQHAQLPVQLWLVDKKKEGWQYVSCQIEGEEQIAAGEEEIYRIQAALRGTALQPESVVLALSNGIAMTQNSK